MDGLANIPPPPSGSIVGIPPPPSGSIVPAGQSAQPPAAPGMDANPNGEGTYQMTAPTGQMMGVPYSKVTQAQVAGHKFTNPQEQSRFEKDATFDPQGKNAGLASGGTSVIDAGKGFVKEAGKTLLGAASVLDKISGSPRIDIGAHPVHALDSFTNWLEEPSANLDEKIGGVGENVAEFMTPEELVSLVGKGPGALKRAAQLEAVLVQNPKMAQLLRVGTEVAKHPALRQGVTAGIQTFLKTGGNTQAALQSASETAAVGGVLGEGAGLLGEGAQSVLNRTADVGGEPTVIPKQPIATPTQAAGQKVIQTNAQKILQNHLEELNESRAPEPGAPAGQQPYQFTLHGNPPTADTSEIGSRVVGAPQSGRAVNTPGQGSRIEPNLEGVENVRGNPSHVTTYPPATVEKPVNPGSGGAGTLTTSDPAIARAHLKATNEIVGSPEFQRMDPAQQNAILKAKGNTEAQLDEYWKQQQAARGAGPSNPGLEKVDIPTVVKGIGSHTEAADTLLSHLQSGYDELADRAALSGQSSQTYNSLKNAYQQAEEGVRGANGTEALAAAEDTAEKAHQDLTKFFESVGVTPKEVAGINQGYANYTKIRDVAKAVDSAFNINPYLSKNASLYRGFNGDKLQQNLSNLVDKYGAPELQRVMGRDGLETLSQIADLNSTRNGAQEFGQATSAIAKWLATSAKAGIRLTGAAAGAGLAHGMGIPGWEGYAAGAGVGAAGAEGMRLATRSVYNAITTNPRIAQNVIFALKSGARPQNYVPFIASLIQQDNIERARQQKQLEGGDQ